MCPIKRSNEFGSFHLEFYSWAQFQWIYMPWVQWRSHFLIHPTVAGNVPPHPSQLFLSLPPKPFHSWSGEKKERELPRCSDTDMHKRQMIQWHRSVKKQNSISVPYFSHYSPHHPNRGQNPLKAMEHVFREMYLKTHAYPVYGYQIKTPVL